MTDGKVAQRVCRKCKESKDLTEANYPHNKNGKDGWDSMCKACWKLRSAERASRGVDHTDRAQRHAIKEAKNKRGWKPIAGEQLPMPEPEAETAVKSARPQVTRPDEQPIKGVSLKKLGRLAELAEDDVKYVEKTGGKLEDHVAWVRTQTGHRGTIKVRYFDVSDGSMDRRFFIELPVVD